MKIELYYAPATCALAPYITLTEAGVPFEPRAVNLRKGENRTPGYLALNPKHQVPVLVIDGEPITENVAIHFWINRNFPAAKLLPAAPMDEVKALSLLSFCSSGIHPFLARINAPARVCDMPGAEAAVTRLARELLFEKYQVAEGLLAGRDFFFDHFTAPDAHFFWCYRRGTQFNLDLSRFKHCTAHFERMQKRPSVQKLLAYEKDVLSDFAKVA
jgi:glutathione S-transferase